MLTEDQSPTITKPKRKRVKKLKFVASISNETLSKLSRFECGKPGLSQESSEADSE